MTKSKTNNNAPWLGPRAKLETKFREEVIFLVPPEGAAHLNVNLGNMEDASP